MTLADLQPGQQAIITKVRGRGVFRRRIMDMGFIPGKRVTAVKSAPLGDPVEYRILGYHVSLRIAESGLVDVRQVAGGALPETEDHRPDQAPEAESGYLTGDIPAVGQDLPDTIRVALVGNPNCGKTSIFNLASNSREHTGNYSGVTVESKIAELTVGGQIFQLIDLPGTYSLSTVSPDELFVRDQLMTDPPDVVVNVVDATNLERNLYLTTQLIDMDIPMVIALNMFDEFERKGDTLDIRKLGSLFGVPVVPTIGNRGKGIEQLFASVREVMEGKSGVTRHIHIPYGLDLEASINRLQDLIWTSEGFSDRFSSRFLAIKMLERNSDILAPAVIGDSSDHLQQAAEKEILAVETLLGRDIDGIIADARYGFITGALRETLKRRSPDDRPESATSRIDRILTHKWIGFPIFLLFLWIMFQSTFNLGKHPVQWIESGVQALSVWLGAILPEGLPKDFLIDGIVGGVGGVIIFLPNILILFFFIALMEDTGYMARVAFIMDKLMHLIGLHGKSFIPLIMGFGCNVPAIMATRTIENRGDRLLTMMIIPLMSCSARLPVYILIAGAVFPHQAANVIFGLYLVGILLSILVALLLRNTLFRKKEAPFVMELPPYRTPTGKAIVRHMWFRSRLYLKKMGGVILIASVIIWALGYFPRSEGDKSAQLEQSAIGWIGKTVQPVMEPLGFDWKMSVAVLSGIAAKEVVVSTMGVLYHAGDSSADLRGRITEAKHTSGKLAGSPVFNLRSGLAFMLFVLIYVPCVAVLAALKRESGKWKLSVILTAYLTLMAWVAGWVGYQVAGLF